MNAATTYRPSAFALAFAAGAVSSAGPCVAPRVLAAAGLSASSSRATALRVVALQSGLTAGYCTLGAAASAIAFAARHSAIVYAALAAILFLCGLRALFATPRCAHSPARALPLGSAFFVGASFALVVSPCCTPMLLGIAAFTASPLYAAALLAAFSIGHGLPIAAVAFGAQRFRRVFSRGAFPAAAACVNGTLLVALGAYYAVLA